MTAGLRGSSDRKLVWKSRNTSGEILHQLTQTTATAPTLTYDTIRRTKSTFAESGAFSGSSTIAVRRHRRALGALINTCNATAPTLLFNLKAADYVAYLSVSDDVADRQDASIAKLRVNHTQVQFGQSCTNRVPIFTTSSKLFSNMCSSMLSCILTSLSIDAALSGFLVQSAQFSKE